MSPSATTLGRLSPTSKSNSIRAANYPPSIDPTPVNISEIAANWLTSFNRALGREHDGAFNDLFFDESYWRDQLALGWDYRTLHGPQEMMHFLNNHPQGSRLQQCTIDGNEKPSLEDFDLSGRARGILAILNIRTDIGTGKGIVRLLQDAKDCSWKAFTLLTVLRELTKFPEAIRHKRPTGVFRDYHSRVENGMAYRSFQTDREPTVLVVGKLRKTLYST